MIKNRPFNYLETFLFYHNDNMASHSCTNRFLDKYLHSSLLRFWLEHVCTEERSLKDY